MCLPLRFESCRAAHHSLRSACSAAKSSAESLIKFPSSSSHSLQCSGICHTTASANAYPDAGGGVGFGRRSFCDVAKVIQREPRSH